MPKKSAPQDRHRADIVAAAHKREMTFQKFSPSLAYDNGVLRIALNYPASKYGHLIADILETTPQAIWPSNDYTDGNPKSCRGERKLGHHKAKFNGSNSQRNVNNSTGGQST